jgi:chromosome segregation ATPase
MSEQTQALPGQAPSLSVSEDGDLVAHLEERVTRLVERYRASQGTIEDLEAAIRAREREVIALNEKISALGRSRTAALERLEGAIAEVDRLERGRTASA